MKKRRAAHWTSLLVALTVGCALDAAPAAAQERGPSVHTDVVMQALALLGVPYRFGGNTPESGFDCSGLVRHVFNSVLGWDLPRRAEELGAIGQPVARDELQPGDLVFFNTLQRAFSHVAIYIGEGRFVHAPARNGKVRVEGIADRYWASRFNGARRLLDAAPLNAVAGEGFGAAGRPLPGSGPDTGAAIRP